MLQMEWHVAVQGRAGERPIVVMGHSFVVVHKVRYWCRMKGVSIERVCDVLLYKFVFYNRDALNLKQN